MRQIFKPLDEYQEFPDRVAASFPAVYLTLISVIQGGALALLLSNTFDYVKATSLVSQSWQFLPYSLLSLVILIFVTFEYTWFVAIYRWSPGIFDVIIPFMVGVLEGIPLFYITEPSVWWLLQIFFCAGGAAAFFHTLANSGKRKHAIFGWNEKAYVRTRNSLRMDILILSSGAVISLLAFWSSSTGLLAGWPLAAAFGFPYFLCGIGMVLKDERFLRALHQDFGYNR